MILHPTTARNLKFSGGFFFVLGAHQRGKLSLFSNGEVYLSFFLYIGVGLLLSFRKINITNSLCRKRNSIFGNGNFVRTSNYNFKIF